MDRDAICAVLPHRDPFLFVDRVLDAGEDWIESEWTVPADGDWFRGHYPTRPVTPGVLLSEHTFQTGALLVARLRERVEAAEDDVPVLTKIEDARFRRMVNPGETVRTRVTLTEVVGPAYLMRADVKWVGEGGETARVLRIGFTVTSTGGLGQLGV